MSISSRWWIGLVMVAALAGCATAPSTPPIAKRVPVEVNLAGQSVRDDYWWLRDKSDPAVIDYLKSENAFTAAAMKPTAALQDTLFKEMLGRIHETDESPPSRNGDWWYSARVEQGKQYPLYVRRKGSATAEPVVVVDVNVLAAGHPFFDYSHGEVSPDGNLLAYSTDSTGNRQYVLQIKDLRDGKLRGDAIQLVDSWSWAADNRTLYYVTEDKSKRPYRLYRHSLGADAGNDEMVYEEKDEQFDLYVYHTLDRKFILLQSSSKTQSEVRAIPADRPAAPMLIEPRRADFEYYVEHRNGRFYIRTNDTSRNFRIVTAPDTEPSRKNWSELVAARGDVDLEDLDVFAHHLAVTERRDGLPQLALAKLPDGSQDPAVGGKVVPLEIPQAEPDFAVGFTGNQEFDPPALRFSYTSLTTPPSQFDLDLATGRQTLIKQQFVGGGFRRDDYQEQRVFATASDGTKIPISLVYRKSMPHSSAPLLLEAYGSYGSPSDVYFSSSRLSLLDRGVILATAHVRGGGEYGRAWYDAGRLKNKPNTFSDFVAAAKYLEDNGCTTPEKLAITGGSAGGLLIGAVLNQHPELFHAAVAEVPWVDVLADMSDPSIPLTTVEYTEWGNPNIPDERAVIASYCPYTNVHPQQYPAILVRESINDSQVQYWDAARWVARLRAAKKEAGNNTELLLNMNMDAGHGGASGRYTQYHEEAFDDAWLLTRLGIE